MEHPALLQAAPLGREQRAAAVPCRGPHKLQQGHRALPLHGGHLPEAAPSPSSHFLDDEEVSWVVAGDFRGGSRAPGLAPQAIRLCLERRPGRLPDSLCQCRPPQQLLLWQQPVCCLPAGRA